MALFTKILTISRKSFQFSVKNFVREILRAFHKRIHSLFNLKISLTRNSSLATVSNGLIFRWKFSQLNFHSQKAHYRPQFINIEWNQCDARVLENWRHNHYMCAKIGQSKFLRQTSIIRFYPSLRNFFFDNSCKISIIIRKYRTYYCPISHNCWYLLYIDTSNVNNEHF